MYIFWTIDFFVFVVIVISSSKRGEKKKKERRYARVHPSTIYHSRYQYVFLSMTSRDSMLVPAPTCSLGSSNICIFASPLFPPFPTSRGIHAWIEGGSIEEFVCLISMEGRWSLKRFAIPNLRMIIHSWKIESGDRMENIERFILIEFLSIFFFFFFWNNLIIRCNEYEER